VTAGVPVGLGHEVSVTVPPLRLWIPLACARAEEPRIILEFFGAVLPLPAVYT
jgi:hypothetical protein